MTNDLINAKFIDLGYSGTLDDQQLKFLEDSGYTTGTLDDRWAAYAADNTLEFHGGLSFVRDNYTGFSVGDSYSYTNSEAGTYVAAMSVEPDDTRKGLIDTMVGSLKSASLWSKLGGLYIAGHDEQVFRVNMADPSKVATINGAVSFTTDVGYAGDGVSAYLDTGIAANTLPSFTDWSLFAKTAVNGPSLNPLIAYGSRGTLIQGDALTVRTQLHSATLTVGSTTSTTGLFLVGSKSGSTQTLYVDGVQDAQSTGVSENSASDTLSFKFFTNGTVYSAATVATGGWTTTALDATDAANLESILETYLTAIAP